MYLLVSKFRSLEFQLLLSRVTPFLQFVTNCFTICVLNRVVFIYKNITKKRKEKKITLKIKTNGRTNKSRLIIKHLLVTNRRPNCRPKLQNWNFDFSSYIKESTNYADSKCLVLPIKSYEPEKICQIFK